MAYKSYNNSWYNNNGYNRNNFNSQNRINSAAGGGNKNKKLVKSLSIAEGPHSPYNFVPISQRIFKDPKDKPYSLISDETYTGEIRYDITAETSIFIDNGKDEGQKDFFKNKNGYAIPGSSMRGLIRNNVQILGFSDIKDDIDDYNLMYRAVTGGCMQARYNEILGQKQDQRSKMSVLQNVKAGYIKREGKDYYIYHNKKKHPDYYVVSERTILEERDVRKKDFQYLLENFQNEDKPFHKNIKNGRVQYEGTPRPQYKPYYCPVSYKVASGKICGVAKPGILPNDGYVISSGYMKDKKAFYIIPAMDDAVDEGEPIPSESVMAYKIDLNSRRNTIKKENRPFYELPNDGEIRPVFYIKYEGIFYFGYTPRLRLMYKNSIHKGIHQDTIKTLDFAQNMFGFSDETDNDDAVKSKVFFTDANLEGEAKKLGERKLILGEPKPTSYLEYLKQTDRKEVSTYDDSNMRLRGIKQYWLQKDAVSEQPAGTGNDNDKVKTRLEPLDKGSRFSGTVRFQNLSKEELGLLLWSIRLEKNSRMNIGQGKPYGYGRIKVDSVDLYLTDPKENYITSVNAFLKSPLSKKSDEDINGFIGGYKQFATNKLKHDVMADPSIKDFLDMKLVVLEGRVIEYMPLNDKRPVNRDERKDFSTFKKNNNPLPTVQEIVKLYRK